MRPWSAVCIGLVAWAAGEGAAALPAFPGAEGFGAAAVGGRGGQVIHVTNLNDDGPGSFRSAVSARGPRIIVFDVGGTIELRSAVNMPNRNGRVTIAAQTAPGGITLIGATVGLPGWTRQKEPTTDIIVRHLRVRGVHNIASPGQGGDCLNVYRARRAILDHCSFTGSADETVDAIQTHELTMQWCSIEEPALWGQGGHQHSEGNHNLGFISSYDSGSVSVHHNLFAHSAGRNPLITKGPAECRNNVVYDFGIGFNAGGRANTGAFNVVGNYFRSGPARPRGFAPLYALGEGQRFYVRDNVIDLPDRRIVVDDPWRQLARTPDIYRVRTGGRLEGPVAVPLAGTTHGAGEAYELVLARAGAWPRDATTRRVVRECRARTGGYGLSGPYERFATRAHGPTSARFDTDRDGMPDAWERSRGLDPSDPSDGARIVPRGASKGDRHAGYTYVEHYLNELADAIVGAEGKTFTVRADAVGAGRVVCEHGGVTPGWRQRDVSKMPAKAREWFLRRGYRGGPLEIDWGGENVFRAGSTVVLKAWPKTSLGTRAPAESRFTHWTGVPPTLARRPTIRLLVDRDLRLTAHFATDK